ncbi:MAG: HlyD family type I secretion periplasmic adaptor subunit [Campylobacterota bacterium]|nr:HlyD family type I secretion periplasmic adaptor subunit [Campylobacterota bacterium]
MLEKKLYKELPDHKLTKASDADEKVDEQEIAYMGSLSAAVLQKSTVRSRIILWLGALSVLWLLFWTSTTQIDEIVRGGGKIIPSHKVQVIQNLEGGIVLDIMVREGDKIKKEQPLLKIQDIGFSSSYEQSQLRYNELLAKSIRLDAQAHRKPCRPDDKIRQMIPDLITYEESLFQTNEQQLKSSLNILDEQLKQTKNQLLDAEEKHLQLQEAYALINEEIEINKPLVQKRVVSEVDYLKLKREANTLKGEMNSVKHSIPRLKSKIAEIKQMQKEEELIYQNRAKKEWNQVQAEMSRLLESQAALQDQVKRTLVRSPVNGTVKKLFVNTVSGVVKPGMDLIEIVPDEDMLLVEAKIHPRDIAFLYPGQKAIVKISAYDFTIYGGLEGEVTHISPDSITDPDGKTYYLVQIKTEKNFLGSDESALKLIVGMVVQTDIITGKKSIMDYLLKPILRAKYNALREK